MSQAPKKLLDDYHALLMTIQSEDVKEEVKAKAKQGFVELFVQIKQYAAGGDERAQYALALSFPEKSDMRMKYLNDAANGGCLEAQYMLAKHHLAHGQRKEAQHWLDKLTKQDDSFLRKNALSQFKAPTTEVQSSLRLVPKLSAHGQFFKCRSERVASSTRAEMRLVKA